MKSNLMNPKKMIVAGVVILGVLLIMVALFATRNIESQKINEISAKEVSVTEKEIKQYAYKIAVEEVRDIISNPIDYFGNPELDSPIALIECSTHDECSIKKMDTNKYQINSKAPKVLESTDLVGEVDYQVVIEYRGYGDISSRGNWYVEEIIIDNENILDPSKSIPIGETFKIDTSGGGEDGQTKNSIFLKQAPTDSTVDTIQGTVDHNMEVTLKEYDTSSNYCLVEVDYKYSGWLRCANLHELPTFMKTESTNN
jgi:hypothetical protein